MLHFLEDNIFTELSSDRWESMSLQWANVEISCYSLNVLIKTSGHFFSVVAAGANIISVGGFNEVF